MNSLPGSRLSRVGVIMALAAAPVACNSDRIQCAERSLVSPIIVEVRDAATGTPAAQGASGTARVGDLVLRVWLPAPGEQLQLYSEPGPSGIYAVVVQKAGYRDWTKSTFVQGGSCGVQRSVILRADLVRSP